MCLWIQKLKTRAGAYYFKEVKMATNEVNPAKGCAGWVKGLFAGIVALIAAGSGLVAILQYMNPTAPPPAPSSNQVIVAVITNEPASSGSSSASDITPEEWQAVEEFLRTAVAAEIAAYQYSDPSYATMFYGDALQTIQGQIQDLISRGIFLDAHFDYDTSYIHDIRVTQTNRIEVDSCEYWSHDYYDRQTGALLSSDSWILVPQTIMIEYVNADFYITSVAFYSGQAFC
jgi:hypothetical protein